MTERELQLLGFTKEVSDGATHIKEDGSEWVEDQFYWNGRVPALSIIKACFLGVSEGVLGTLICVQEPNSSMI